MKHCSLTRSEIGVLWIKWNKKSMGITFGLFACERLRIRNYSIEKEMNPYAAYEMLLKMVTN